MTFNKLYIAFILALLLTGCTNRSLFTILADNSLEVRIKGTFESHTSANWGTITNDDSMVDIPPAGFHANESALSPTTIRLDIAEMKLVNSNGKASKFSIYRQKIVAGLNDTDTFFTTGVVMDNDDPKDGDYTDVLLYIRKLVIDGAVYYQAVNDPVATDVPMNNGWQYVEPAETTFWEKKVIGFDVNQLQLNSRADSLREESSYINRVFPVRIPIEGGLHYSKNNSRTVLEIRLVLKNFLKKYEFADYPSTARVYHFYGPSDWLNDVQKGDKHLGGNLLAVARAYVPGETGTISVTSGATAGGYVVVIPSTDSISNYYLNSTESAERIRNRNSASLFNAPVIPYYPGNYHEQMMDYYLRLEGYYESITALLTQTVPLSFTHLSPTTDPDDEYEATSYEGSWNRYWRGVSSYQSPYTDAAGVKYMSYKIPPIVAYTSGTTATIEKVPPGDYRVFTTDNAFSYGTLLEGATVDAVFNPDGGVGNPVTVTANNTSDVTITATYP